MVEKIRRMLKKEYKYCGILQAKHSANESKEKQGTYLLFVTDSGQKTSRWSTP
jgi:hypothetical protein